MPRIQVLAVGSFHPNNCPNCIQTCFGIATARAILFPDAVIIDTTAKKLLFATVRIEGGLRSGGTSVGTGFVLSHDFPDYGTERFLVTNKHVVNDMESTKLCFTRRNGEQPVIGHTFAFSCSNGFGRIFHVHPDHNIDIAVLPISFLLSHARFRDRDAFLMDLSTKIIPSAEQIERSDAMLSVLFVGYPSGLFDTRHMTPIVRRGTLATPLQLDYEGTPAFLIDASVFPGSSGSPVFGFDIGWNEEIANLRLLGIIARVFTRTETGVLCAIPAPVNRPTAFETKQMIDLGVVFKSHLILETILDCWRYTGDELRRINRGA